MRIIFHPAAASDLRWFRRYYVTVFPQGAQTAKAQYQSARLALLAHPFIGHSVEGVAPMRELHISGTPFSFVYFVNEEEIIITRLLDSRAPRPETPRL